jgi:hypothetical protein
MNKRTKRQIDKLKEQVEHGLALIVRHQQAIDQLDNAVENLRGCIHLLQFAEPDETQIQERIAANSRVILFADWRQR